MFKGPKGPQSGQTIRTIAEKQNSPSNFNEGPAYDATAGLPEKLKKGSYSPTPHPTPTSAKPLEGPAPFSIKGS